LTNLLTAKTLPFLSKDDLGFTGKTVVGSSNGQLISGGTGIISFDNQDFFKLEFLLQVFDVAVNQFSFNERKFQSQSILSLFLQFTHNVRTESQTLLHDFLVEGSVILKDLLPVIKDLVFSSDGAAAQNFKDLLLPREIVTGNDKSSLLGLDLILLLAGNLIHRHSQRSVQVLKISSSSNNTIINLTMFNMRPSDVGDEFRSISREMGLEVLGVEDFSEMGADGVDNEQLEFDVSEDQILSGALFTAREEIIFLERRKFEKTVLKDFSESHAFVSLFSQEETSVDFIREGSVNEFQVFIGSVFSEGREGVQSGFNPGFDVGKSEDSVISGGLDEVGIIKSITGIGKGDSGSISTVDSDGIIQSQEVTQTLGHLFTINVNITVAEESSRPVFAVIPNSGMVVERHGEMVSDEILGRDSQVQRIPVLEVFSKNSQFIFGNSAWLIRSIQEDIVPSFTGQIFMRNVQKTSLSTFKITLDKMSNSVVSHIDGGIRKRFNQELGVARKSGTQTEASRDTPFLKPANGFFEGLEDGIMISVEFIRSDVIEDGVLPFFLTVSEVPLINIRNNTLISRSGDNFAFRFIIDQGLIGFDHFVSDQSLDVLNLLSSIRTNNKDTFIETLIVDEFLGLSQMFLITRSVNLEFFTSLQGRKFTIAWDFDDFNRRERKNPFVLNVELLSEGRLVLEILKIDPIVRRIRRNGSDYTSTLIHADRKHGPQKDSFIRSKGGLEGSSQQVSTVNFSDAVQNGVFLGEVLESEVSGGSFRADEDFFVSHNISTISASGEDIAVGLAVHGFRSEGSGNQRDSFSFQELELFGEFEDSELNQSVFLRINTFTFGSIVISARLVIKGREDGGSLAELELLLFFQMGELPSDQRVIIRVLVSGDERSSEIGHNTESIQIYLSNGREIREPVMRAGEVLDFIVRDTAHSENAVLRKLSGDFEFLVSLGLLDFFVEFLFKFGGNSADLVTKSVKFDLKLLGSSRDGHTSTMETERPKNIEALEFLVSGSELSLSHGITVTKMELTVHIRIREGDKEFRSIRFRFSLVEILGFPDFLSFFFDFKKSVTTNKGFFFSFGFH
jgi:hypothetical protein